MFSCSACQAIQIELFPLDSERRLEDYEKPMNFIKNKKPQLFLRHNVCLSFI